MIRALLALALLLVPTLSSAQQVVVDPIVRVDFEEKAAVPGQSLVLRVTVLVPTWMPKPPVMPTFDAPNLMVRSDGRAATAISERIDGATWSGISRKYLLFPLVPGRIGIPAQSMVIHYADPETRKPVRVAAQLPPTAITGSVPEGAADLEPLIVANALSIEQSFDRDATELEPGDAVVRTIKVSLDGSTPMVVPSLSDAQSHPGLSVYVNEPDVLETQSRGVLAGSRTETITYVAEAGGRFAQPAITLRWFNLSEERVEEARLDGFEVTVRGPPPTIERETDWRGLLLAGLPLTAGIIVLALVLWRLWPQVTSWRATRREAYLHSERYAYRQAERELAGRRLDGTLRAVRRWWAVLSPGSRDLPTELDNSLATIGSKLYGRITSSSAYSAPWSVALQALGTSRRRILDSRTRGTDDYLPDLNPSRPPHQ